MRLCMETGQQNHLVALLMSQPCLGGASRLVHHFDQLPALGSSTNEPNRLESYLPLGLTNEQWARANLESTLD